MATPPSAIIIVTCSCGTRLKVSAASVGKKAKCPKCQGIVTISAPQKSAAALPTLKVPPAQGSDLLGDLAELGAQAEAAPPQPTVPTCPHCGAAVVADARVCTACGYDLKKGRLLTTRTATESDAKEKAAALAKSAGTFVLGSILSLVGALVGGAVWFLVAWYLNAEVGYVAVGIGFVAGVGMMIGHKVPSMKAGAVAAAMSAVGIIAAKATIFFVLLYAVFTGDTNNIEAQRAFVAIHIANQMLDEKGVTDESERERQWEATCKEAERRVRKMSDDDVRKRCEELREAAANEPQVEEPIEEPGDQPDSDEGGGILLKLFIKTQFGLFDLLWFFLALGTAYKIGNAGLQKEE